MNLRTEGYDILTAADGEDGMRMAFDARPDLILLDLMLPGWTGWDILEELRKRGEATPVLVLSARDATPDKVRGLNEGADDYLTKPFDRSELMARVRAMLRRHGNKEQTESAWSFGDLTIDRAGRSVTVRGNAIELTAREFDLLCLLASAPGRVFTREAILERVWGWDYEGSERTVDNFVANLRKKLRVGRRSLSIRTLPRVGYSLEARP